MRLQIAKNNYCLWQKLCYGLLLTTLETLSLGNCYTCSLRVVNVVVEPCVYGLPRCPHCNARTGAICDAAAVIKECQHEDVSTQFTHHHSAAR